MFCVGSAYAGGDGIKQDFEKSFYWHSKAAELGNLFAQSIVGLDYWVGRGVVRDLAKAREWLEVAAKQGQIEAQINLGSLLIEQREYLEAAKWCTITANLDAADGQYCLGTLYERGLGVEKDLEQAKEWYWRAAQQGHARAHKALMRFNDMEQKN
jgi:uncharacterized protein